MKGASIPQRRPHEQVMKGKLLNEQGLQVNEGLGMEGD
jgi:hypothetical protein